MPKYVVTRGVDTAYHEEVEAADAMEALQFAHREVPTLCCHCSDNLKVSGDVLWSTVSLDGEEVASDMDEAQASLAEITKTLNYLGVPSHVPSDPPLRSMRALSVSERVNIALASRQVSAPKPKAFKQEAELAAERKRAAERLGLGTRGRGFPAYAIHGKTGNVYTIVNVVLTEGTQEWAVVYRSARRGTPQCSYDRWRSS